MIQLHNLKNGLYSTHELITKIEDYQFSKEYKYYKYPFALLQNNLKNVVFIRRGSESVDYTNYTFNPSPHISICD